MVDKMKGKLVLKNPAATSDAPKNGANGSNFRTLWKASLLLGDGSQQEFLYRAGDDFLPASAIAEQLIESSPGATMAGARLVRVEKIAHLWN